MDGWARPTLKSNTIVCLYRKKEKWATVAAWPYDRARACYYYAQWLKFQGLADKAAGYLAKSRELCQAIGVTFFDQSAANAKR